MPSTVAATASPREGRAHTCRNISCGCNKRGLAMSIACGSILRGLSSMASVRSHKLSARAPTRSSQQLWALALTSKGYYPRIRLHGGVRLTRGWYAVSRLMGALTTQMMQDGVGG